MMDKLNELIQRSVEHGIFRFFTEMEAFLTKLTLRTTLGLLNDGQQLQSESITMDNIWIYAHIFIAANCFSSAVFLGEILIFLRKKILRALRAMVRKMALKRKRIARKSSEFPRRCMRIISGAFQVSSKAIVSSWMRHMTSLHSLSSGIASSWRKLVHKRVYARAYRGKSTRVRVINIAECNRQQKS